ncbi:anticodon nuclease [Chromobacterium violaceum]|uniref:Anticodon nuclease n=1 Tax=Chromobacterium violaceum TaxID=536 RepID=A0A202BF69_CHRVL|nr:anticodon nuclease [Chromobacterium violaceum]OVE50015.1 anticodon nuclease [Chromobacterium violaceum]
MSDKPTINTYANLQTLARKLRSDLTGIDLILLYAYNRTGKTRLSMEFKGAGKRKTKKNPDCIPDTLYFNAYTEDLFTWDNDLEYDTTRGLRVNQASRFFDAFKNEPLEPTIDEYLKRYADFDFDFTFQDIQHGKESFSRPVFVKFSKGDESHIKISRGEQNIFIWCVFMAICEQVLKYPDVYPTVKYFYIDDPISSLDDNNAIAVACDLAKLLRSAASRKDENGAPAPIKVVFSSHHALFFNVMCNELGRTKEGESKVTHKRFFLHRPNGDGKYTLRATEDTPFFHHVASLAELQLAAAPGTGKLYTFHFNALRSIMEKTASFFGHADISFCLRALNTEDVALYNRALNLLSHGKYAIHEPTEMGEDNKELFRRIFRDFTTQFQFDLPEILETAPAVAAPVPEPAP